MAIISRFRAVALIGKLRLTGVIAWLMWLALHLIYITGFKNRVTALLHWAVSFLGRGRSERTTTEQQIFARAALGRLKRGAADLVSDPGRTTPRGRCWRRPGAPSSRRRPRRRRGSPTPASAAYPPRPGAGVADPLLEVARRRLGALRRAPSAGRMNTPSASTVTPSASGIWPLAQVLMPSMRSIHASARRSPSGVPRR